MMQISEILLTEGIVNNKTEFCRNFRPIPDFRCLFNRQRKQYTPRGYDGMQYLHRAWIPERCIISRKVSMKIGIVCYPTYGGSGVIATELGLGLARKGHEVHIQ